MDLSDLDAASLSRRTSAASPRASASLDPFADLDDDDAFADFPSPDPVGTRRRAAFDVADGLVQEWRSAAEEHNRRAAAGSCGHGVDIRLLAPLYSQRRAERKAASML